ncbi:glycerophosphodiester phosphodiesterase [Leucobacter sp. gxy201]|uniref:glycerophosphodiester phosphodiesterase family protein n=1 Tax=Leucobacter sp. gxy201 TaxID=2957200 RepID=UPI003DA1102B
MPHPYFDRPERPRIIAHRGFVPPAAAARGIAENTRAAFAEALAAGADCLESDCHLTNDDVVVLFHDDDLARVSGDPRKVAEVSHRELAQIMSDRGGLLTLSELFEEFPEARVNLDVKAAAAADPVGRSIAPHAHRTLVTSFSDEFRLRALRSAACATGSERPATSAGRGTLIKLLLAVQVGARRRAARLLEGVDALQIPERQGSLSVFTPRLVDAAHDAGVEVHVWTVNDPDDMRSLARRGADAIITDRTDLALSTLR